MSVINHTGCNGKTISLQSDLERAVRPVRDVLLRPLGLVQPQKLVRADPGLLLPPRAVGDGGLDLGLGEDAVAVGVDEVARPEEVALGARPQAVAVLLAGRAVGAEGAVVSPLALARVALAGPVAGAKLK